METEEKQKMLRMGYGAWRTLDPGAMDPAMAGAIRGLKAEEFNSPVLSWVVKNKVPVDGIYSFRKSLAERRISRRDFGNAWSEWAVNDKITALRFVERLGVAVPAVYLKQASVEEVAGQDFTGRVLKPSSDAGSRGVYLLFSREKVYSLTSKRYMDGDAMLAELRAGVAAGRLRDSFNLEQMILEPDGATQARDLKFYCFYGVCGLVLEIVRGAKTLYCFHDREGRIVDTGRYQGSTFIGEGVTPEQVRLAESISAEVPCPFIRVDFLKTAANDSAGMVFGEFAPAPGGYETFNATTDLALGKMWAQAEVRLFNDLLEGKEFAAFRQAVASRKRRA